MNKRSGPKFTRAMLLLPLTTEFAQRGGDVEALLLRHKIPLAVLRGGHRFSTSLQPC